LNSFSRRVAVSALAVVIGLGLVGCGDDIPTSEPPPDQGSTVGSDTSSAPSTSVPSTSATSESPGGEEPSSAPSTSSEPAPSVAPNDAKILAGLRDQGYTCKGEARCRRVKDNIEEIIEVGNGRAVFVVKATRGTSADLEAALSSVLDDYGSVLPKGAFAGQDWKKFTVWADEHAGDDHAKGTVAGWHTILEAGGPKVRKLVLKRN